jgi:hypothetical protein
MACSGTILLTVLALFLECNVDFVVVYSYVNFAFFFFKGFNAVIVFYIMTRIVIAIAWTMKVI